MQVIVKELRKALQGEVKDDLMSKHIYSVDASIYEVCPDLVILPKSREDLVKTVEIANKHSVPIIPRGGGTGIAGGCLGPGIVLDTSKYLNKILEVNLEERWALCEPGVLQDQLNHLLSPHGLRLGPDTSTGNRATLGGMAATNAAGSHYLRFGNMLDHVLEIEMILSSGKTHLFSPHTCFEPIKPIINQHSEKIRSLFPTIRRRSSGYSLNALIESPLNLAKLLVGSEGTLGLFSAIKVSLSESIRKTTLVLLPFSSLEESLQAVPYLLSFHPISLELIDHHVIEMGKTAPSLKGKLHWLKGSPAALLIVEFEGDHPPSLTKDQEIFHHPAEQRAIWALRKAGLSLLLSRRSYSRAIAFIEDMIVPSDSLPQFVQELKTLVKTDIGIYGHAGDGCLHIRPYVDLRSPLEVEAIFRIMKELVLLTRRYGGLLSSEHGDGLIRSWLNQPLFGEVIYSVFEEVKKAFDPIGMMNPGKIVEPANPREHLRLSPETKQIAFPTFLSFEKEGGLHLAADLCNGNGACRSKESLMCPSFQAFGDEKHSTRARAQSLRALLNGKLSQDSLTDHEIQDVLGYCLECKGCKTECPSQVDMAKMKMEMLFQFQEKHGYSLLNRLFGHLPELARLGSSCAPLSNWMTASPLGKGMLSLIGVNSLRPLPKLSPFRFSTWWAKRPLSSQGGKQVLLFNDTYTEFFTPEVGQAAVFVLESCGFSVKVLPFTCCGRPLLSKGFLKKAQIQALKMVNLLKNSHSPLIILEPSCQSALLDDYVSLFPDLSWTQEILSLEAFLLKNQISLPISYPSLFFHPHCHEKALGSSNDFTKLFSKKSVLSQAGCCGLAGSFGYEKKFAPMSIAIGESRLFPEVREIPQETLLIASGFSCRCQIEFGTGRKALHPAEFINKQLRLLK